jgi:hypothetical protein
VSKPSGQITCQQQPATIQVFGLVKNDLAVDEQRGLSCAPGGITVSESIRTAVKDKVTASFDDQGTQPVKIIAYPEWCHQSVTNAPQRSAIGGHLAHTPTRGAARRPA